MAGSILKVVLLFWIGALGAGILVGCGKQSNSKQAVVLAVVGGETIDAQVFRDRYRQVREKLGAEFQDTGQLRRQVLRQLVNEAVLVFEAKRRGFDRDSAAVLERKRLTIQQLLNAFHRKHITSTIQVTENELIRLFKRLNTRIKARHLYAPTRAKADSLYALLMKGASFEQLAREVFTDPRLKATGGLLGYFTVDEMEPAFEEAAFRMRVGEISPPVKTLKGYSIIKVEDIKANPLVTETEFARHRPKLEAYWRYRKLRSTTQTFVDSLRRKLNVEFDAAAIDQLFRAIRSREQDNPLENLESHARLAQLPPDLEVVRFAGGRWTLADFRDRVVFTSDAQKKRIRTREALEDFIAGLVVREYMLEQAKRENLDKTPAFQKALQDKWEKYLIERMREALLQEMVIPEDSLRAYYDSDPGRFAVPPRYRLRQIVVADSVSARRILHELQAGAAFDDLARRYSIETRSARNGGDIGYYTPMQLGRFSSVVQSMEAGQYRGPLRADSLYLFLQCVEKIPPQIRTFEQARADVERTVRYMQSDLYLKKRLDELKRALKVQTFEARLRHVTLN